MGLRSYQEEMVDAFWTHDYQPGRRVLGELAVGGGKTHVLAEILRRIKEDCPSERSLVLAHRKELLVQSAQKINLVAPHLSVGVWSAGLGKKQLRDITVAGVQSIYRQRLPTIGTVIIDECHLLSPNGDSMYQKLLSRLANDNPELRVLGLTATPWRLGYGTLLDGDEPLFHDVCYEVGLRRLVDEGWLVPFVSKVGESEANLSSVRTRGGEYVPGEAEAAMDTEELVRAAVAEIIEYGANRRSWLVFAAGVKHAEHVCAEFVRRGVPAACVFGHTQNRERVFSDYKAGRYRAIVNCEVATTGLDIPQIDLIALLRPTKSPGLLVQISGRGSRPLPGVFDGLPDDRSARKEALAVSGKPSCLFLDFTQSVRELGPLDAVRPPLPKGAKKSTEDRESPVKVCPNCRECVALAIRECPECAYPFPEPEIKHAPVASSAPVMSTEVVPAATLPVLSVAYKRHSKAGRPDSFRVDYFVGGFDKISEWVCLEHEGFAAEKARRWWHQNAAVRGPAPTTVAEALERTWELKKPISVVVRQEGKYDRVVRVVFDEAAPAASTKCLPIK